LYFWKNLYLGKDANFSLQPLCVLTVLVWMGFAAPALQWHCCANSATSQVLFMLEA
jgi:hypothetical protein